MTEFTIATFNVKNLIGADQEYYRFERYTPEEYAWKIDWLADQLLSMNADVICFQEVFDEAPLIDLMKEVNRRAADLNAAVIPDRKKRYSRKAIFSRLKVEPYDLNHIRWTQNANDGEPGQRRPGLAIVSRFGFAGDVETVQVLDQPMEIAFDDLDGSDAGVFRLTRLSRPMQVAKIPVGSEIVTIFNVHFKSKLGEYPRRPGGAVEADLLNYAPLGRAIGELRAATRRMAEAAVLREHVLMALDRGEPVMALGDFNDSEFAVSSAIVAGERPFRNYAWMRRHDAERANERYSEDEADAIRTAIEKVRLWSAEKLFVAKSLRDMVYTTAFGGVYESIDQILLSRHFAPENDQRIGDLTYLSVLNDHLTDGAHPEAPYNKLASDHGQLIAHITLRDGA